MSNVEPSRSGRPFQFGLGTLLLITALLGVLAAALGGMLRGRPAGVPLPLGFYIVMAVAAPLGALIVVSLLRSAIRLIVQYLGRR